MNSASSAGIVIVTRNREKDLRLVLEKLKNEPRWSALPVWIHDDTSSSVSADYFSFLKENSFSLARNPARIGLVACRNQSNAAVPFDFIFSLDDDSCFLDSLGPAQALDYLRANPQVGALCFPVADPQAPASTFAPYACAIFTGCAHLLRKEVFLKVGGYRADFVHQGEEVEFCMRLWAAGYEVHAFPACRVHHWVTDASRDWERMGFYGPRNRVWTLFLRVPLRYLPLELVRAAGSTLKLAWRTGLWMTHLEGFCAGLGRGVASVLLLERKAMSAALYKKWRCLPLTANEPPQEPSP